MLYFAYGSNLDIEDLARYCAAKKFPMPQLTNERLAYLPGHKLVFNSFSASRMSGVANIQPTGQKNDRVYGALYDVKEPYFKILDLKEGAPAAYERRRVEVALPDGLHINNTVTYAVVPARVMDQHVPPKWGYVMMIVKNGKRLGFPAEYVKQLESVKTTGTK